MSRPTIYITIPKPCHESWDAMDVTERGAFCQSCQKEVIDFSAMTDREVIEYLEKHKTGCGRFSSGQIERNIIATKFENGVFRWRALFLGFLSMISIKNIVAQSSPVSSNHQIVVATSQNSNAVKGNDDMIHISGKVTDENNEGLIGASILLLDSSGRSLGIGVCTDLDGNFFLDFKRNSAHQFRSSYTNYYSGENKITNESKQSFIIRLQPKPVDKRVKVIPMKTMGLFDVNEVKKDTLKN